MIGMIQKFAAAIVLIVCFATLAFSESRLWVCEFCGKRVYADNRPMPGSCDKNHLGNHHSWQEMDKHAKNRTWICEYCGHRSHSDSIPPTQGCTKNPFGKKVHHWVMD